MRQKDVLAILAHLAPHRARGQRKVRVGSPFGDGGYAMLDDFGGVGAAYSLGIGWDVSWDLMVAERGLPIHQFDHTIDAPPADHPNFRFRKLGIAAEAGGAFTTLPAAVAAAGDAGRRDLLLKMDIEGSEWPVFDAIDGAVLNQFRQIVLEVHHLTRLIDGEFGERIARVLAKLDATHAVVHVHANNCGPYRLVENVPVPDVIELTYARRDSYELDLSGEIFPTELDRPCNAEWAEIVLGAFRFGPHGPANAAPARRSKTPAWLASARRALTGRRR